MTMEVFGLNMLSDLRVVACLILIAWTLLTWKKSSLVKDQIPEPRALPIIGHLHLFGKLAHLTMMKLAGQYGPIMKLRLGSVQLIVVSNAKMAREFLKAQDAVWASRPPNIFGELFFYNYSGEVLQPLNDLWRKLRKLYFSEFLSTTNVERQKDQRHESVMRTVNSMLAIQRENEAVDVYASIANMNFYQMVKLMFGKKFSVEYTASTSTGEKKSLPVLVRDLGNLEFVSLGECIPWLKWLDVDGVKKKLTKLHSEFDGFLSTLLEERQRQMLSSEEDGESKDLARALLSMLDKEDGLNISNIKAALTDMIFAGIETTASVVTSAIAEVMKQPDVKKKLVKELEDVVGRKRLVEESDLVNLHYVKMVIKETLRLHPPIPIINHYSTAPTVVAGYHIPAKSQLLINFYALQRDPDSWEDPLTFKPERFANNSVDVRGQHFELLPFGAGRRQCPGMNMAMVTSEIVLAQLFQTLEMSLCPGMKPEDVDMTEETGIAMALANPLKVVIGNIGLSADKCEVAIHLEHQCQQTAAAVHAFTPRRSSRRSESQY